MKTAQVKAKGTTLSEQMTTVLSSVNWTVSQRQTESGQTLTIRINYNRSIALERSVIKYCEGLNRFYALAPLALEKPSVALGRIA